MNQRRLSVVLAFLALLLPIILGIVIAIIGSIPT